VLGVVWSLGTLVLMHYEMTILTGIIPPLIVVIGIPNTMFILNKYYHEYELAVIK
jgi:predicted RND superfamily exporter protein